MDNNEQGKQQERKDTLQKLWDTTVKVCQDLMDNAAAGKVPLKASMLQQITTFLSLNQMTLPAIEKQLALLREEEQFIEQEKDESEELEQIQQTFFSFEEMGIPEDMRKEPLEENQVSGEADEKWRQLEIYN